MYFQNMGDSKTANKAKNLNKLCFKLISQNMTFQCDFVWAPYQTFSLGLVTTKLHYCPYKGASISICVLNVMNHYFHSFHTIYEVAYMHPIQK